mmetsp:Transcript_4439/g.8654  ORF Transcript_4439/g.8654 Transcript_4439/m.8654 type:complete len:103 (-) Transcript_4439:280-588(-)
MSRRFGVPRASKKRSMVDQKRSQTILRSLEFERAADFGNLVQGNNQNYKPANPSTGEKENKLLQLLSDGIFTKEERKESDRNSKRNPGKRGRTGGCKINSED